MAKWMASPTVGRLLYEAHVAEPPAIGAPVPSQRRKASHTDMSSQPLTQAHGRGRFRGARRAELVANSGRSPDRR